MSKSIKILSMITVIVLIAAFMTVAVYAGTGSRCGKNGCTNAGGANGTVFCAKHAAEYARENGMVRCGAPGCGKYVTKNSRYCYTHQCQKNGCSNQKVSGSDYCSSHQPKRTTYSGSTRKSGSYSSGSYSGSGRKYDTYDVYSYKDPQSFADDMYEEFYDYEDDYEDEDEAYDAAEDYWYEHH